MKLLQAAIRKGAWAFSVASILFVFGAYALVLYPDADNVAARIQSVVVMFVNGSGNAAPVTASAPLPVTPANSAAAPLYVRSAGSTGLDYSANMPTPPNVGANFAASGPYANYVLVDMLPATPTRVAWHFQNASGFDCVLAFDDGTAASGAAPVNASMEPIDPSPRGAAHQGGGDGDSDFKGRIQVYCSGALVGNPYVMLNQR